MLYIKGKGEPFFKISPKKIEDEATANFCSLCCCGVWLSPPPQHFTFQKFLGASNLVPLLSSLRNRTGRKVAERGRRGWKTGSLKSN
jgi:hypothetical protein